MESIGRAPAGFYRAAEVARMLRCSEWWVKEQARRRRIPFCWIGGSYLFTVEHVAAIVRLFEVHPVGDADRIDVASERPACGRARDVAAVRLRARPPRRRRNSSASAA